MRKFALNFLTFFFIFFKTFAQSADTGILYLWELSTGRVWKNFGDEKTQQIYKGEIKNRKPEGLGIMLFPDGTKYMGMWKAGKKHGQGTLTMSDGQKTSGEWKENKEWNITKYDANEKIIAKSLNGEELADFKKEGVLFYRTESGRTGWFKTGDQIDGYKYVGEWKDGKKNGQGIYFFSEGDRFEGNWKYDEVHGKGTYVYPGGERFSGEWKDGNKHKHGRLILPR